MRRLAVTLLVLALLGGTTVAFAVTQRLKLERSPVTGTRFEKFFSPTCGCATDSATLSIRLRRADRIDAVVHDAAGEPVRVLAEDVERPAGRVSWEWDGRDDAGEVVADGTYRLRVHLRRQDRTISIPTPFNVDTAPPRVELLSVRPKVFSPDDDGRRDRIRLRYRSTEPGQPEVLVRGERAAHGRSRKRGRWGIHWGGRLASGEVAPAGTYSVAVRVVDRAGNASEPTRSARVRVRYVELVRERLRTVRGGVLRFRVRTDADAFGWTLERRKSHRVVLRGRSTGSTATARLPARVKPGRYVLRALVNGHEDVARVVVR